MAAFAALTLLDGQATPVSHTFSPVNRINEIARYADRVNGIAVGFPTVNLNIRQPIKGSRAFKVVGKVSLPILEVTSPSTGTGIQPAPTVAYTLLGNFDFVLPERSTLAQRNDVMAFTSNLIANAVVKAMVQNYESVV